MLCDQGDWEKATATYARSPRGERRQEPRGERLPRGRAGRRRARGKSASQALARIAKRSRRRRDARARAPARRPRRPAFRARRGRRPARPCLRCRSARTSRSPRSTRGSSRSRADSTRWSRRRVRLCSRRPARKLARAMALTFGTRWVLRHQNLEVGARFLEEALKLDPAERGRVLLSSRGLRQEGGRLGLASSTSPRKRRRASRTATARSSSPRRAPSRGGSSAT